jgi:hypothetical protein
MMMDIVKCIRTDSAVVAYGLWLYFNSRSYRFTSKSLEPIDCKENTCPNLVVVEQLKNVKRWKKKYGYGMRWIAESAFSSIKRTFGEYGLSMDQVKIKRLLLI